MIKEQRADLVKHHLWVLWTDYFKPPHFEKYPELHELFNKATKKAGGGPGGAKSSTDPATGQELLDLHRADRQDLLGDQGRGLTPEFEKRRRRRDSPPAAPLLVAGPECRSGPRRPADAHDGAAGDLAQLDVPVL